MEMRRVIGPNERIHKAIDDETVARHETSDHADSNKANIMMKRCLGDTGGMERERRRIANVGLSGADAERMNVKAWRRAMMVKVTERKM